MPTGRHPRIQVTGRARVGKTTVRKALSLLSATETGAVDRPGHPDPRLDADLVVYVLGAALYTADRRLLAAAVPESTIVVLNKADAIGTGWPDAAAAAERCATEFGIRTFPVVATLAEHTRAGALDRADLRTLQRYRDHPDPALTLSAELFGADFAADTADRRALLTRWGRYGVACALTALRHDPALTSRTLLHILHRASGIDAVHEELHHRYEAQCARLRE